MFSLERGRPVRLSLTATVVVVIAFSCAAQTSRVAGAIQGSVVDQTGSAVANATVTLRNQGTNQTRTMSSNAEDSFRASDLPFGPNGLLIQSPGFSPTVKNVISTTIEMVVQISSSHDPV